MNLKYIEDRVLRNDAKEAALKEKSATFFLIHYIREVDRRKLYSDWKFTSLFDWCVRELGLCEGSAHIRIRAAKLLNDLPEIEEKLLDGRLTLSTIVQVDKFCRDHAMNNIIQKQEMLKRVENLSKREAEKRLYELTGKKKFVQEGQERISDKKHHVTYILSDETLEAIKEVKKLLGKDISHDELLNLMAKSLKEKIYKTKFKQVERPRKVKGSQVQGRAIPAFVKREVYDRDDQKCVNCGSNYNLNFDHINPYALGGRPTSDNIRLLCFHCNQRARIKMGFISSG